MKKVFYLVAIAPLFCPSIFSFTIHTITNKSNEKASLLYRSNGSTTEFLTLKPRETIKTSLTLPKSDVKIENSIHKSSECLQIDLESKYYMLVEGDSPYHGIWYQQFKTTTKSTPSIRILVYHKEFPSFSSTKKFGKTTKTILNHLEISNKNIAIKQIRK